jgi:hypothetical protein
LQFCPAALLIPRTVRSLFIALSIVFAVASLSICADEHESWRDKFNETYQMDEGEALKRIAPPYIPERKTYYQKEEASQARYIKEPPTYFHFRWTGSSFDSAGYGFMSTGGLTIRGVLQNIIGLRSYEYQIPKDAASFELKGDWMVDAMMELEPKLQKLCDIVRDAKGPSLQFTQKESEEPVVVAKGTYTFHPLDDGYNATSIHLYVDKPDKNEGSGGGSGDLAKFLSMLGDRVGMQIIDEVEEPRPSQLSWGHHSSTNFKNLAGLPEGPKKTEKIQKLLDMVSKQTELKLTIEQRKVPLWVAEPAPK